MALLGNAAMMLWYDIVPEQIAEHDDWHTREHFPERVAIPGFMRAQRWVAESPGPRYFVVYEVVDVDVLSSAAYLDRLNHPTAWTTRLMPNFRGMVRGFMSFQSRHGQVLGTAALSLRFSAAPGKDQQLRDWLDRDLIPDALRRRGITSAFVLRSARTPDMTVEQRIRGGDAGVDTVLLLTAYSSECLQDLSATKLASVSLEAHGAATQVQSGIYALACLADTLHIESTGRQIHCDVERK